jgi:5-methylcytosine-specific restriction endonuclease McrA
VTSFPKSTPPRLKGKDMEALRIACFLRDGGKCTGKCCGKRVWLRGYPQMHMAHWRNKRMYGDTLENVTTRCEDCHLVGMHNPKSVPPKEAVGAS